MSGGEAFVYDPAGELPLRLNDDLVTLERVAVDEELRRLVERHLRYTESPLAGGAARALGRRRRASSGTSSRRPTSLRSRTSTRERPPGAARVPSSRRRPPRAKRLGVSGVFPPPPCINADCLHNTQMVSAAVIGAAGFSGQETLDRVLAHPELDLVALGSDSLAGQPAAALDPRLARNGHGPLPEFVSNAEALASGADVVFCCFGHKEASALDPPADAVVVDLSGAHRLADRPPMPPGTASRIPGSTTAGATRCRSSAPPTSRLIANPGCYATAALLALAPLAGRDRAERGRRRREVGCLRGGPLAEGELACGLGAGERLAVPGRRAPARAGDRAAARLPGLLRAPFAARAAWPDRHLLRAGAEDVRSLLEAAYVSSSVVSVLPEGAVPDLARVRGRMPPRSLCSRTGRPAGRSSSVRSTTSARAPPARPSRTRTSRSGSTRRPGFGCRGSWSDGSRRPAGRSSHRRDHRREGIRRRGRPCRDPALEARPRDRSLHRAGRRRRDVHRQPRPGGAVLVSKAHLAQTQPQAIVINSGVANAATGKQGELDALATAAETAELLDLEARQVLVLSTGVIGAKLPMRPPARGSGGGGRPAREGRRPRRRRSDPDDGHVREGVGGLVHGVHGRGDGEGRRDDPPAPGDHARGRHHRLPARGRRGPRLPQGRR